MNFDPQVGQTNVRAGNKSLCIFLIWLFTLNSDFNIFPHSGMGQVQHFLGLGAGGSFEQRFSCFSRTSFEDFKVPHLKHLTLLYVYDSRRYLRYCKSSRYVLNRNYAFNVL